jgi:2-dehydro-3-deoxygalactonokinase
VCGHGRFGQGLGQCALLSCPAGTQALAEGLHWVEPGRTAIVPGLSIAEGQSGDVMRGEEVQLLGAVAAGLAPADGCCASRAPIANGHGCAAKP